MDVHARQSGSPMRSIQWLPPYESRGQEFFSTGRGGGSHGREGPKRLLPPFHFYGVIVIGREAVTENVLPAPTPPSEIWRVPLAVSVIV